MFVGPILRKSVSALFVLSVALISPTGMAATAQKAGASHNVVQGIERQYSSLMPYGSENDPRFIAQKFVKSSGLYKGLSLMLLDSVKNSPLVSQAIKKNGFQFVQGTVVESIREITDTYRSQWDHYLVNLYSRDYSPELLKSVLKWREESPYFNRFISQQVHYHKSGRHFKTRLFQKAQAELNARLMQQFAKL